jgi:hypothetical protein
VLRQRGANRAGVRDTRGVRATGLQGDASVDIIEIIDDGTDVFGDRVPNTTIYDSGGPRWVGPVAAAALVAIIGYGIATSASRSSVPRVAPAPSTTAAPSTTQPSPTTTIVAEPLVPFYAADAPRELTVQFAHIEEPPDDYDGPGNFQLWATPGSTATSGSWFSLENYPGGFSNVYAIDAYRVEAEQMPIAVSHTATGLTLAQFAPNKTSSVNIVAFGLTDDDLIRIAQSVRIARDIVQFSDRAIVEGYELTSTLRPWFVVQGIPIEQVYYADGNNPDGGFSITVAKRHPVNEGGTDVDRQTALQFLLRNGRTFFEVGGNPAIAGELTGEQGYSLATWIAGDHLVTVSGSMPVAQLASIAETVHEISAEEWNGLQFQATRHNADNNFGNYEETTPVPVSFGTDANSQEWTIRVSIATFGDKQMVNWQWPSNGFGSQTVDTPRITTVVESQRTYVLADLPRAVSASANLQVTRDGMEPILVPFADTDPEFDRTFAAYAFSEPTPYTAQIIDADGIVLANWPSS